MSRVKRVSLWVMALFYIGAGVNHFLSPDFYLAIMPPYLAWHLELVYVSGVAEIVLGVMLLLPQYRVVAAWGVILLLIAVFPANLHQALNDVPIDGESLGPLRWVRLPFQAVLIAWAWWHTRKPSR